MAGEAGMKDWPMFIVSPGCAMGEVRQPGSAETSDRDDDIERPGGAGQGFEAPNFRAGEQEEMIACLICGVRKDSAVEKYCVAEIDGFNKKHGLNLTFGCEVPPTEEHSFVEMPGLPVYYGVSLVDDFIAKFNGLDRKPEPVSTAVLLEDFNHWEGSR
jgi:hypothetical protein